MTPTIVVTRSDLAERLDALTTISTRWPAERTVEEGLRIAVDHCDATSAALYRLDAAGPTLVGAHPDTVDIDDPAAATGWFPWGLGSTNPRRFLFIEDTGDLLVSPGSPTRLADRGIRSCAHLPISDGPRTVGYLQIHWSRSASWHDEASGHLLRLLGRFLLVVDASSRPDGDPPVR